MIVIWDERTELMRDYLCARCWGLLKAEPILDGKHGNDTTHRIFCEDCGNEDGFVSHQYVTWRQERNLQEYYMAKNALREAVPWMFRGYLTEKDEKKLLEQLGY